MSPRVTVFLEKCSWFPKSELPSIGKLNAAPVDVAQIAAIVQSVFLALINPPSPSSSEKMD